MPLPHTSPCTYLPLAVPELYQDFPGGAVVKNLPISAGDAGSIPVWERSPGVGNDNPFPYSCLGNPLDRGAWRATVHGAKKTEQLSTHKLYPSVTNQWSIKCIVSLSYEPHSNKIDQTSGRGCEDLWSISWQVRSPMDKLDLQLASEVGCVCVHPHVCAVGLVCGYRHLGLSP